MNDKQWSHIHNHIILDVIMKPTTAALVVLGSFAIVGVVSGMGVAIPQMAITTQRKIDQMLLDKGKNETFTGLRLVKLPMQQ
ncbi:hypothetical protein MAR_006788 [Mya arenaria]|uniref:Uncharacterized protein n=1 Tax=Mya arenaria TaxID=6604 RepID=A0ABY7D9J4_MYAAR|nr:hypothetical protein MAR_006788 [Mya arenaria]